MGCSGLFERLCSPFSFICERAFTLDDLLEFGGVFASRLRPATLGVYLLGLTGKLVEVHDVTWRLPPRRQTPVLISSEATGR